MGMERRISIKMLGGFDVLVDGLSVARQLTRTRKGTKLLQYLVLKGGEPVPTASLHEILWANDQSSSPEGALKTLISRTRIILGEIAPELGEAIVTSRGAYRFNTEVGIYVDIIEIDRLCGELANVTVINDGVRGRFSRLLALFQGELLTGIEREDWVISHSTYLRNRYLKAIYRYLDLLKPLKDYTTIIEVCRQALDIDMFDERLHLFLMDALVNTGHGNEAMLQYKHLTSLHTDYLGARLPEAIQNLYKQSLMLGRSMDTDIETVQKDLIGFANQKGAFVCDYSVFKSIYGLLTRNYERMGWKVYLALVSVTSFGGQPVEFFQLGEVMKELQGILMNDLRKSDTMAQYSASQYVILLPMVNHESAQMVLERLKRAFYKAHPNSTLMFSYRLKSVLPMQLDEK